MVRYYGAYSRRYRGAHKGEAKVTPVVDTEEERVVSQAAQRFRALDGINDKYGEFTVAPATILDRSEMPNVIAPAWRPSGHRQHIPD